MGLDMYLSLAQATEDEVEEGSYIPYKGKKLVPTEQVGYWRKFNALHNLIVQDYAHGVDRCQPIILSIDNVREIIEKLETVSNQEREVLGVSMKEDYLNAMAKIESIMPTASGFFFGSTSYDEWYFSDVREALNIFQDVEAMELGENEILFYQASW